VVLDVHSEEVLAARTLAPDVTGVVRRQSDVHGHGAAVVTDDLGAVGHSVADETAHLHIVAGACDHRRS